MVSLETSCVSITQLLWEGAHGMTSLRITSGDDPWIPRAGADTHAHHLIDSLLLGILAKWPGKRHAAAVKAILSSPVSAG